MECIIGIDPGKSGGIAVISPNTGDIMSWEYSDENLLRSAAEFAETGVAYVEQVGARPGQGVTGMFNFGKNYGYILGVLDAYGIPYTLVHPKKWKSAVGVTADKKTSIRRVKELFPGVDLKKNTRCRTDHDGKAEAILIAFYGMIQQEKFDKK